MNNDYKNLIQDIILEEVNAEVINEAWWDRVKAKVSGGTAGVSQSLKNLKNKADGGWRGLSAGIRNQSADDAIKNAHASDIDPADAAKEAKIKTWKKSLTNKIYKFEEKSIRQAQNFVSEIYDDIEKLGLKPEELSDYLSKSKGLESSLNMASSAAKQMATKIAKIFNDAYTTHREIEETKKREKEEKKRAAREKAGQEMETTQQNAAETIA